MTNKHYPPNTGYGEEHEEELAKIRAAAKIVTENVYNGSLKLTASKVIDGDLYVRTLFQRNSSFWGFSIITKDGRVLEHAGDTPTIHKASPVSPRNAKNLLTILERWLNE